MVRLELLSLNTMGALDPGRLADAAALGSLSSAELRHLGRLPHPMVRRRGEPGFRVIGWDEALDLAAGRLRSTAPERIAFYLTSRGIPNETYYAAQKAARFLGTNHVDNSARLCHAASTVAMKEMLGQGASTTTYRDWLDSDLIVFFGSNVPNNQPVTTKYLYHAKKNGRADRGRQPVPGAGARALLGALGSRERALRHEAGRRLVRRGHRGRPRVLERRAQGASGDPGRGRRRVRRAVHGRVRRRRGGRARTRRGRSWNWEAARRGRGCATSRSSWSTGPTRTSSGRWA